MSFVNQRIIKHKMGLLNLAEELRNVSRACRVMGVSRETFYCDVLLLWKLASGMPIRL